MFGTSKRTKRRWKLRSAREVLKKIREDVNSSEVDVNSSEVNNNLEVSGHNLENDRTDMGRIGRNSNHSFVDVNSEQTDSDDSYSSNIAYLSDSSDCEVTDNAEIRSQLANWSAVHMCVTHRALKDLLVILHPHFPGQLPEDPRTLRSTPRQITVQSLSGGQFVYFGVKENILRRLKLVVSVNSQYNNFTSDCFCRLQSNCQNKLLSISVGIDGVPMSRSSKHEFWPILGKLDQFRCSSIFVIGLFYGKSKPSNLDFLREFVDEMKGLEADGIVFGNEKFDIRISTLIADTPARNFLKCVKSFNSYSGCDKCTQVGEWEGRMVFPEIQLNLRSDDDFLNQSNPSHHKCACILSELKIGLVSQVPFDYMHLVCLGVVRKIVRQWVKGKKPHKLRSREINQASDILISFKKLLPKEFQRKPRSLFEIDNFKATEFRTLLLYTGYAAFCKIPENYFKHFLLLHAAMFILLSDKADDVEFNKIAETLLLKFVETGKLIYGNNFCVFNVHGLLHLASDARYYGNLNRISAFPFENFMQQIKKMKKSNTNYLAQVSNRIIEREGLEIRSNEKTENFRLCNKSDSNCIALRTGEIVIIKNIISVDENVFNVSLKIFQSREDLNPYPIASSLLGIYRISNLSLTLNRTISKNDVLYNCILLPLDDDYICIPLIHTINQ